MSGWGFDTGNWNQTSIDESVSAAVGSSYSYKWDGTYLYGISGNYVQVRNKDLELQDEHNMGDGVDCEPVLTDFNRDNTFEFNVLTNDTIWLFEFNGTELLNIANFTYIGASDNPLSYVGIGCDTGRYSFDTTYCYVAYQNGTNDNDTLSRYSYYDNTTVRVHLGNYTIKTSVPAIDTFNGDSNDDICMQMDFDDDGNYGYSCFDTVTGLKFFDVDDLGPSGGMANPIIHQVDGAGEKELIIWAGQLLRVYNSDETYDFDITNGNIYGSYLDPAYWQPVVMYVADTTKPDRLICGILQESGAGSGTLDMTCAWNNGSAHYSNRNRAQRIPCYPYDVALDNFKAPIVADFDDDGEDEILISQCLIDDPVTHDDSYSEMPILTNFSSANGYGDAAPTAADFDDDSIIDIMFTRSSWTKLYFSAYSNQPPEKNASRELGRGTPCYSLDSHICVGTTVTWRAEEDEHYTNDIEVDYERLLTTCDYHTEYQNGTQALTAPTISCTYNETGAYDPRIYLQDMQNTDDFTEYWDIDTFLVTNGTPGTTCNIVCGSDEAEGETVEPGVSDDDEITTEEDIEYVIDTLTGQTPLIEGIMVVVFTLAAIGGLAYLGITSAVVYGMVIFAIWIVLAVVGLLSWMYVALFAFVAVALASLGFALNRE